MRLIERAPGEAGIAAAFAGEAVLDAWPGGVTARCRNTVIDALHETMTASATVAAPVRARAGSVLGALGDPRDLSEMVPIPAGTFLMGEGEGQHKVHLDAFRIGKYPVTNGQYAEFVAATGYEPPSHWRGKKPLPEVLNHPVTYVSWHDARAYCAWLSELRGEEVRLPTEAEWEKAARGTDGRRYPWGDGADPIARTIATRGFVTRVRSAVFRPGKVPMAAWTWRVTCGSGRAVYVSRILTTRTMDERIRRAAAAARCAGARGYYLELGVRCASRMPQESRRSR